jgi:hypothetical protein
MELQSLMQESNVTTESPYGPAVDSNKAPEVISKVRILLLVYFEGKDYLLKCISLI